MKKLIFNPNTFELDITDPQFLTIVIENKKFYWDFNKYLYGEFPDHVKYCSLFVNGSEVKIEDVSTYIYNVLDLNLNTKQNLNALYKILKKSYFTELTSTVEKIQEQLETVCKEIKLDFDAELTMESSIRIDDVFKIGGLQFVESENGLLENISRFILVGKELRSANIVFINHLHDYLEDEEIANLIKEIQYKGITLINLETNKPVSHLENEKIAIIDSDLCSLK